MVGMAVHGRNRLIRIGDDRVWVMQLSGDFGLILV